MQVLGIKTVSGKTTGKAKSTNTQGIGKIADFVTLLPFFKRDQEDIFLANTFALTEFNLQMISIMKRGRKYSCSKLPVPCSDLNI